MLKDITGQKRIDRDLILAAISALKEKGWDVNPYSVADEAKISRSSIVRDADLMELVAQARGSSAASAESAGDMSRRLENLEEQNKELHAQKIQLHEHVGELQERIGLLEGQVEELEDHNKQLRHHNKQLQQQVGPLSEKTAKLKEQLEKLKNKLGQPPEAPGELESQLSKLQSENLKLQEHIAPLMDRNKQLYDQIVQLLDQEEELQGQNGQLRAQLSRFESGLSSGEPGNESRQLQEQVANLQRENENLAQSVNLVWQQGYLMGQHDGQQAAIEEFRRLQGTAAGAEDQGAAPPAEAPEQAAGEPAGQSLPGQDPAAASALPAEPLWTDALPADLGSETLEIRSDPFTARLWEALQSDTLSEPLATDETAVIWNSGAASNPQVAESEPFPDSGEALAAGATAGQPFPRSYDEPSFDRVRLEAIPPDEQLVSPPPGSDAHSYFSCNPDGIMEKAADTEPGDARTSAFTESELRDLLKNRFTRPEDNPEKEPENTKEAPSPSQPAAAKKFVGTNRQGQEPPPTASRVFPPEIRKACLLLGLKAEELSRQAISEAWKREMAKPGVHPDTGGDTEMAIYLNTAKDTLMRWVDDQSPKLGKKFGATRDHHKPHQEKQE